MSAASPAPAAVAPVSASDPAPIDSPAVIVDDEVCPSPRASPVSGAEDAPAASASAGGSPKPASAPAAAAAGGSAAKQRRSSVLSPQQQNVLEKSLGSRPAADSLKAQGIVKDGGRFAAEKSKLQRALASHQIARDLSDRPDPAQLSAAGILEQAHVAPSLAGRAKALNKKIVAQKLSSQLAAREEGAADHYMRATEVAPRLRGPKIKLQHAITRDRVGQMLEVRPDMASLLQNNILASPVSARLAGTQRMLQRNFTADLIGHLLEQRSNITDLEKEGVLKDVTIAPRLQGVQRTLERNLAKSNLFHALQARPSVEQLASRGIWQQNPELGYYDDEEGEEQGEDYAGEEDQQEAEWAYQMQMQQQAQQQQQQQQQLQQQQQRGSGRIYTAASAAVSSPLLLSPSAAANRAANLSYAHNPAQSPNTTASYAGMAAADAAYRDYLARAAEIEARQNAAAAGYEGGFAASPSHAYYNAQAAAYQQQQQQQQQAMAQQQQQQQAMAAAHYHQQQQQQQQESVDYSASPVASSASSRRSLNFHLTRLLLKACVSLGESGEISAREKSFLKELIVDQVPEVYLAAEKFDQGNGMAAFRATLVHFAKRR